MGTRPEFCCDDAIGDGFCDVLACRPGIHGESGIYGVLFGEWVAAVSGGMLRRLGLSWCRIGELLITVFGALLIVNCECRFVCCIFHAMHLPRGGGQQSRPPIEKRQSYSPVALVLVGMCGWSGFED